MLRRRIFAYAVMLIVGITGAYLFFECNQIIPAICLMLLVGIVVQKTDLEYRPDRAERERCIIFAFVLIGFLVFTFKFIDMHAVIRNDRKEEIRSEDVTSLSGTIIAIEEKDDGYSIIVKPTSVSGINKIKASYYNELPLASACEMLGAKVTVYGELKQPAGLENPGCFNYRSYLFSKNVRFTFSVKLIRPDDVSEHGLTKWYWMYRQRIYRLRETFLDNFNDENIRGFIKGVVFGNKSEIDDDTLEEFNSNSTGHILAVSGLHVGFLFALLRILTRKKKSKKITVLIIITIVLYGEMTGWSPSTARAVLVLSLSTLSLYARRTPDLLTSVSTAAICLLLWNPYNLVNSGFQMSFIALLGICFLTEPLSFYVGEPFAVLLSIQLTVSPMIAYSYSAFNISSMFVNIPIVFLAGILVPACIISLAIMLYLGFLPEIFINMISNLSNFIITVNSKLSFDRFFVSDIQGINPGILILYYLIIFFLCSEWTRIKILRGEHNKIRKMIPCLLIPALIIGMATYNFYLNDEVVFVNVGQGDCTHIRCGENDVLIDGGGNQYYNIGKNTLKPYLLHNNVKNIELALITHQHTDHYKGIEELNEIFPIGAITQGYMNSKVTIGKKVRIEGIWPEERALKNSPEDNPNELNSVYIIYYENIKIMVTGDLIQEDEIKIIQKYRGTDKLKCDVLKVGHHGSKTSTSDEFLDTVDPDVAVIEVGQNNSYGHPNQETLDKLASRGIKTYRTDLNGAVGIDIRRDGIKVDTMR